MSRRTHAAWLPLAAIVGLALSLHATPIPTFTWTGKGGDNEWFTDANWQGGTAPSNGTPANIVFGNADKTYVTYNIVVANSLTFSGNTRPYTLESYSDSYTIYLGTGGLTYTPAQPVHSTIIDEIALLGNQTWNIASGQLTVTDRLFDYFYSGESWTNYNATLNKTGSGTLVLESANSGDWNGGLTLSGGQVVIGGNCYTSTALGSGTLTFNGGTLVAAQLNGKDDESVYLYNNVVSNGLIKTVGQDVEIHLGYHGEGNSEILLNADTTITAKGKMLILEGNIVEGEATGRSLTVDGPGAVVLTGYNSYTGGTTVNNGILVFGQAESIPAVNLDSSTAGKLTAAANGYVGFGDDTYSGESMKNIQTDFLDQFDKSATTGTIGFDTDPERGSANAYYGSLDLTGFSSTARLGSATKAILNGDITPQGSDYRFGGGGGWLQVGGYLTGARNVVLDSPADRPLTVRFTNPENDFSGNVSVTNSGAIFATGALPGTATFTLASGAYLGTEDAAHSANAAAINAYVARFGAGTPGIIGFDLDQNSMVVSTRVIDLTGVTLGSLTGGGYLGTASILYSDGEPSGPGVQFTGTIAPNADGVHRFAAYKGGGLQVSGTLTGTGLVIGHPGSLGAFGDRNNEEYSNVVIDGDNAGHLANGTTFYGGRLFLGQSNGVVGTDATSALGSGALTIAPVSFTIDEGEGTNSPAPLLASFASGLILNNNIHLNAPELDVGGDSNFTLNGVIDGTGELYVGEESSGSFVLTLGGANSYSGGTYVSENATIIANTNTALGTGKLDFGSSSSAEVHFTTDAPVIGSLSTSDDSDYAGLFFGGNNPVFTINQAVGARFSGEFRTESPNTSDAMRVVKSGAGTLFLQEGGLYYYHGTAEASLPGTPNVSLQVNQGTLILSPGFYIEDSTPTVWVHGGKLAFNGHVSFNNPVVVDNGGQLLGQATFSKLVSFGTGTVLAPGNSPGTMTFAGGLSLSGGTVMNFDLGSISDQILVTGGTLTGPSSGTITLNLAAVSGFGPGTYVLIDWTGASVSNLTLGSFNLGVVPAGTSTSDYTLSITGTQLTAFTAVPEPSTYALLGLGLGLVGLTFWRRRRA